MLRGALYGLSAAAIWGGMYVVSDIVLPVIPPFTLLTFRLLFGIFTLAFLLMTSGKPVNLTRRKLWQLLGVGFLGFGISIGAQFVGTDLSTAMNGSLITSASPAFIVLFAAIILKERLTPRRLIAIGLATVGVLFIIDLSQANFGSQTFLGDVALIIAALTWGLYSVLVRAVSKDTDTLVVTLFAFYGGSLLTIPTMLVETNTRPTGEITLPIVLGILYLGVVSTAGAMWLWNRAFALVDASVASLFFFAQPLVGAVLSAIVLQQPFSSNLLIGSALIAAGVLLALRE